MVHPSRKRPSAAVRAIIAHRQDYNCAICDSKLPVGWQIDHVIPLSSPQWKSYGSEKSATKAANDISNLQALCCNCHGHKTLLESSDPSLLEKTAFGGSQEDTSLWTPSTSKIPVQSRRPKPPLNLELAATNIRKRSIIDIIWSKAASRDTLTELLLDPTRWKKLSEASTTKELRLIYRDVRRKRMIDYKTFKQRVDHLLGS